MAERAPYTATKCFSHNTVCMVNDTNFVELLLIRFDFIGPNGIKFIPHHFDKSLLVLYLLTLLPIFVLEGS
jgi:hypothetical protein